MDELKLPNPPVQAMAKSGPRMSGTLVPQHE
jgi:hypothetical protein